MIVGCEGGTYGAVLLRMVIRFRASSCLLSGVVETVCCYGRRGMPRLGAQFQEEHSRRQHLELLFIEHHGGLLRPLDNVRRHVEFELLRCLVVYV